MSVSVLLIPQWWHHCRTCARVCFMVIQCVKSLVNGVIRRNCDHTPQIIALPVGVVTWIAQITQAALRFECLVYDLWCLEFWDLMTINTAPRAPILGYKVLCPLFADFSRVGPWCFRYCDSANIHSCLNETLFQQKRMPGPNRACVRIPELFLTLAHKNSVKISMLFLPYPSVRPLSWFRTYLQNRWTDFRKIWY